MAEREGLFKKIGKGFDRYIGGLLGEDLSKMTPEERAIARRQAIGAIGQGMINPANAQPAMANVMQARAMQREREQMRSRAMAAEQEMPRITGRLFGTSGGMIEGLQEGEAPTPLTARYRANPQEALSRMYGTQAGRDVASVSPELLQLAQEGVTGRTVGGAVYNPLTGAFSRPQEAQVRDLTPEEVAALRLPRGTVVQRKADGTLNIIREPAVASAGTRFDVIQGAQVEALGFPQGTVLQRNAVTGELKVLSSVPAAQRAELSARDKVINRVDKIAKRIEDQLDQVETGGPLGVTGAMSRIFDSKDARLFESYRQQLSGAIRAALRIPGEGALSDFEQRQYGLQLPELGQSKENNKAIIASLKEQVRAAKEEPISSSAVPDGVTEEEWNLMTPAERALFE